MVREILIWLKENLMNNGFNQEKAKIFLKEFAKMGITGGTLYGLKNDKNIDQTINSLRNEFSTKNQTFGIWIVVKSCIQTIGDSENFHC